MTNQHDTPLLTAIAIAAQRGHTPFYAPGHKQGRGAALSLQNLLGLAALRADLPELPELDNLFAPTGPIREAQVLAAAAFGVDETYFLANGSTCGIEAALLAVAAPGDAVLVPRNAHRSVLAALILTGAQPIYIAPVHDRDWDLAFGMTAAQVATALHTHPEIRAVVMVSPSYHGVCSDVAAIAAQVHAHGAVLIADEAHGAHLGFHPALPPGAIAGGADLVIQSTHKTLGAVTQAAMLHVQGQRVNRDRLRQALQLTQSTSPNYWLLASLDAARYQMATTGKAELERVLTLSDGVRSRLAKLDAMRVLRSADVADKPFKLDPTRLVVDVSGLGLTGFTADEILHEDLAVTAELPTLRQLAFILSVGNTEADGDRLVQALQTLVTRSPQLPHDLPKSAVTTESEAAAPLLSLPPMTPRAAFFAETQAMRLEKAEGKICADAICPYPPGIPLVLPGEIVTQAAIAYLQHIHWSGGLITGCLDDQTVLALRVVA